MKVAIVEPELFGGTCANTGYAPTETLVASRHASHLAERPPSTLACWASAPTAGIKVRQPTLMGDAK
jgi:pyruvate/2-oxoglutarate dehydrogenase complex dihydrolipoamide dehydrogenase (E3) component